MGQRINMRLWSIHPRYLDRQGLIALWREALLAQKVLDGKTKGYKHHPQLIRFRETDDALASIGLYLQYVAKEADRREYCFDRSKILKSPENIPFIPVTRGQFQYEFQHLLKKLEVRDPLLFEKWANQKTVQAHPIFKSVPGEVADWEKR